MDMTLPKNKQMFVLVSFLIIAFTSIWIRNSSDWIIIEEEVPEVEEVEELAEITEQQDEYEVQTLEYSSLGILKVPYEHNETFNKAFAYAKAALGDSSTTGAKQFFMWRGGMFHTESQRRQ